MYVHPFTVLLTLISSSIVFGGKVLVFPMDGSHWFHMKLLITELHSRGHHITVMRPEDSWFIQDKSPHYQTISMKSMETSEESMLGMARELLHLRKFGASVWSYASNMNAMKKLLLHQHETVVDVVGELFENQDLMLKLHAAKYDMVLTDPVLGAGVLMAHYLGIPLVHLARLTSHGETHFVIAPSPISYVHLHSVPADKMTFREKLHNMVLHLIPLWWGSLIDSTYDPLVQRYFGPDAHYRALLQAADIWLLRVDFTLEFPRPTLPNIIYIAGFQSKPAKPLPRELEDFVQSSGEHGLIVMSLGTLVAQLPEDVVEEIAAAFAKLPQKVIWRYKGRKPHNLGSNTLLLDWLPQNDLLGHTKTKAFISHGGINGIQEAIYHGVPLVGLPLMYDQPDNFIRMEVRGVAKVLDIGTVNRDTLVQTLKEVLYTPSYRQKMKALSEVHRDTPLKPLDTALFWLEFVMRHGGAKHLLTASHQLSFLQYHSIDVILFLLASLSTAVLVFCTFLKLLCKLFYQKQ